MKFTTLAYSAALFSSVFGYAFQIFPYIDSTDPALNGKYLTITYRGDTAARNDITFAEKYGIFYIDVDTKELYSLATEKPYAVKDYAGPKTYWSTHNGYLVAGATPAKVELFNSVVYIQDNDQFYVLGGSIYVFNIAGSTPIKLKAFVSGLNPDPNSISSSSSAPPSSSETPSSPPSSPTPTPSGYTNTTITTTLTYTEACTTVITVTTCAATVTDCPARHTPVIVTTVIPVTKTTTYCPATTTPTYEPYTATYGEPYTPTVAGESIVKTTAPVTEVPNGAAKAGSLAGIGMLAVAAYLF